MDTRNETMLKRALFIDFDLYAENDPDFKLELIELMIENLHELRQAYYRSVEQSTPDVFLKTCHKVKTTLFMLADKDLNVVVEDLKNPGVDQNKISAFNKLNAGIITSLSAEKSLLTRRTGTI